MKLKNIKKTAMKAVKTVQKHSPEILITLGVVGTVTGTVMACKATTKLPDILDQRDEDLVDLKNQEQEISEKEMRKGITKVYAKTALSVAKEYAPAAFVGSLSIASVLTSNHILRKRNMVLVGAYTSLKSKFDAYTDRVIEKYGEDAHKELLYGIRSIEVKEKITDENGKTRTVKNQIQAIDKNGELSSPYAFKFDSSNPNWNPVDDYNMMFLNAMREAFNLKLHRDGHVFLNEIRTYMSEKPTYEGQFSGWVDNDKNEDGDSYIDLRITKIQQIDDDGNLLDEFVYILDPNVEGNIVDKLWS